MAYTSSTNTIETVEDVIKGASQYSAIPLWPQMVKYNPPNPNPKCTPHIWRYDDVRPYLVRAGELVKEKDAERRVLMLINPERGASLPLHLLSVAKTSSQRGHIPQTRSMQAYNS